MARRVQNVAAVADDAGMRPAIPSISAAAIAAAATRIMGTVVLFVEDHTTGPAVYKPRLEVFTTVEGEELGADDGTVIPLIEPGTADELIATHGTPGRAAAALNRQLRAEWGVAL
jgi:hypothetical protein